MSLIRLSPRDTNYTLSNANRLLEVNVLFKTNMIRPSGEYSHPTKEQKKHTSGWNTLDI